jgi:preprotein translocase SecF subunit
LFDFVGKRRWFFLGSSLVILAGIISLIVGGLNLGLDFKSGVTMTLVFSEPVAQEDLRVAFGDLGYGDATIQHSPKEAFLLPTFAGDWDKLAVSLEDAFNTTVRTADLGPQPTGNHTLAIILGTTVSEASFSDWLKTNDYGNVTFSAATLDSYLVRIGAPQGGAGPTAGAAGVSEQDHIKAELTSRFGPVDYLNYESISQAVASERVSSTGKAVAVAALGILLYIAWSFRKLQKSFRFGVCAIVSLVHDGLIVLTVFSVFRLEVNSFFIIAILTVIGYGVNNVIVVFDRIRENRGRHLSQPFDTIVNMSATETLTRSVNTSLTTLLPLLALVLFGGATIHSFVLALTVGVVAATYSSLFIAPQLVVAWEFGELDRLFRWIPWPRRRT